MKLEQLNDDGALALRNAIVEQAAKDYVELKQAVYAEPDRDFSNSIITDKINTIEKWFRSRYFDDLCTGYSGEWFITELCEFAKDSVKIIVKPRKERGK